MMGRGKRRQRQVAFPVQRAAPPRGASTIKLPDDVEPAPPGVAQCVILSCGTEQWYTDGLLGREGGPAVIHRSGRTKWYRNGKLHRDDGPAVISEEGVRAWYRNGHLHREDGPAFETPTGNDSWWLDGEEQPVPDPPAIAPPGAISRPSALAGGRD